MERTKEAGTREKRGHGNSKAGNKSSRGGVQNRQVVHKAFKLALAREYRERGWKILPLHHPMKDGCCSCGESGCTSVGKHPKILWRPEGQLVPEIMELDDVTLEKWFGNLNNNIGIATGPESALVVLDIDGLEGETSLEKIGLSFSGPEVKTARGRHLYFKYPDFQVKNAVKILPGIDVRGKGGCVVAPLSRHASGCMYSWVLGTKDLDLPELPEPLINLLKPNVNKDARGNLDGDTFITEGERNMTLYKYGCALRGKGHSEDDILEELAMINTERCESPLDDEEVRKIARSVAKHSSGGIFSTNNHPQVRGFNAAELLTMKLPPQKWAIKNILPEGLTILAGSPKTGKSYFVLQIALAISTGGEVFGKHTG